MTLLEITAVPFSYIHSGGGERYPTEMIRALSKIEKVTGCYSSDQWIKILEGDVLIPAKFIRIEPFISYSNPIPTLIFDWITLRITSKDFRVGIGLL